jgi:hypothetical protein
MVASSSLPIRAFYQMRLHLAGKPTTVPEIKEQVFFMPIVAWKISAEARVPITIDDVAPTADEVRALLLPTGAVIASDGVTYKDFEAWSGAIFKPWRERSQQKAAA